VAGRAVAAPPVRAVATVAVPATAAKLLREKPVSERTTA
jgi:hypothetical protein